ncbi:hypothetical protein IFM58399_06074 [Aspergillus lentulus]|uniref:uncharacterized protein n=1 Tax=Aspergillus lentulus TaxID=293939 RepID=UPI0013955389|nr:uncharacterized protein IFM58399_06074 [Aspergillus lentulus]GFF40882.1 hypothetical protein IFM58399_06074 [Aspergillus lentulus]GFF67260.1 hypothetical protein IFM62136_06891 [Aspergillus lentulus]GFG13094.1 hypothetical protein IFM61392_07752 [Aspergillus lentulus]
MNNKAGDKWNLEAYDETTELPYPEEFSEFFTFLGERSLCLETGCLLIHKTDRALEYLELAYDGSTKAEAQVRARLDILPGLVLGLTKEDGRIIEANSVSWGYTTPFWKTIQVKFRNKLLRSRLDYALWRAVAAAATPQQCHPPSRRPVWPSAIPGSPSHSVHPSAAFQPLLSRLDDRAAASGSSPQLPGQIIEAEEGVHGVPADCVAYPA